jgi:hypothetical protein
VVYRLQEKLGNIDYFQLANVSVLFLVEQENNFLVFDWRANLHRKLHWLTSTQRTGPQIKSLSKDLDAGRWRSGLPSIHPGSCQISFGTVFRKAMLPILRWTINS